MQVRAILHAMNDTAPEPEAIPAATLVIFRRGRTEGAPPELLMVTRSRELVFAGGAAVWPGGRIDPADHDLAAATATKLDQEDVAARIAAIRETLEETGLAIGIRGTVDGAAAMDARAMLLETLSLAPVLERFRWQLDLDALVPFARWFPRGMAHKRLFDTRFYLADLGTGSVDITVDRTENTHLFWTSAQAALDMAERGEISVIFPTARNLERLAQFPNFQAAKRQAEQIEVRTIVPEIVETGGTRWLTIPEDAGYPVTRQALERIDRG